MSKRLKLKDSHRGFIFASPAADPSEYELSNELQIYQRQWSYTNIRTPDCLATQDLDKPTFLAENSMQHALPRSYWVVPNPPCPVWLKIPRGTLTSAFLNFIVPVIHPIHSVDLRFIAQKSGYAGDEAQNVMYSERLSQTR